MEKEMVQSLEWVESQKIEISIDLFAAAKQHLHFLGVVDKNQWLFDGPLLERAIYRYNVYWLPLLAKYSKTSSICEGPLVPPLDCEWIWHCHRLNPVRYTSDCQQFYEKVLGNSGIVSSTNASGSFKTNSENLWKRLYPMEPYNIDLDKAISESKDISSLEKHTTYNLVSAVKRQNSFYSKVLKANVENEIIMQEAVGRYKAFLYLFKRNREMSKDAIGAPTLDIDLIWHTHQLSPSSYYNDLKKIFGNIVQHDDDINIVDNEQCKKLDDIFFETTAQWEEMFGQKYWKSNAKNTTNMVVEKKNDGSDVAADEKKNVKCVTTATKKKDVEYDVNAVDKKSAFCNASCVKLCLMSEVEKKSAMCFYSCRSTTAEKKSVGCVVAPKEVRNNVVAV